MSTIKSNGGSKLLSSIKDICSDGAVCEIIATVVVIGLFFGTMVVALMPTI